MPYKIHNASRNPWIIPVIGEKTRSKTSRRILDGQIVEELIEEVYEAATDQINLPGRTSKDSYNISDLPYVVIEDSMMRRLEKQQHFKDLVDRGTIRIAKVKE